ncbi:hypothetical protein GCM10007857_70580 [Bradyrhizobium iriomotense]|uniref:Uncharacterized protein n=1 Tax=Bradyrhizobium iriomotense TaxID=441950 RepID=A0ABQ6B8I5_9BRAD|nr:hypothetical protein GCM10007857_70580 [Bradyrhizobium iriomotense]
MALRLHKHRPAGSETAQRIVQPAGNRDKFGRHGTFEIWSPESGRPLKRAILIEDHPLINQRRPGQKVGKTRV